MKHIILLTSYFPYISGEQFIIPEIDYVSRKYDLVICPCGGAIKKTTCLVYKIPQNISCEPLFHNKFSLTEKVFFCIRIPFLPLFWEEVFWLIKRKKFSISRIEALIHFVAHGEHIFKRLENRYRPELRNDKQEFIFYSYWMAEAAYAAARLVHKYGCTAVCRAHGGDLYAERKANKYLPMRRYILKWLSLCCPVSLNGVQYLTGRYGYKEKIKLFYLGSKDYGVRMVNMPPKRFIIASCSNLIPLKRVQIVAEALSFITDIEIDWIHFGDGIERKNVENAARKLPPNIHWQLMGNIPHERLMEYYSNHDIHLFINVSKSEGLPVSIIEAISFGIPVIATDVGGTREIVFDGKNGFLIKPELGAQEISEIIKKAIRMEIAVYAEYRDSARAIWEMSFIAEENMRLFYKTFFEVS
jgi:colanic acid/amylovoran biosynthesis glycosyltransferase